MSLPPQILRDCSLYPLREGMLHTFMALMRFHFVAAHPNRDTEKPFSKINQGRFHMRLDRGIFTVSLDFELLWGCFDSGKHHRYTPRYLVGKDEAYRRTRHVIDRLLTLFHHYDIAVTWATIGHLFLDHCDPHDGIKHPEMPRPQHSWFNDDWYIYDPGSNLRESPLWYGRDMVEQILAAEPKHDV